MKQPRQSEGTYPGGTRWCHRCPDGVCFGDRIDACDIRTESEQSEPKPETKEQPE